MINYVPGYYVSLSILQGDEEIKSVRLDKEVAENLTKLMLQEEEIAKQNEVHSHVLFLFVCIV